MTTADSSRQRTPEVYDLHIPGRRRPFRSILPCPERIYVAWHKDAKGIHELLDANGHSHGHPPTEGLWEVVAYDRKVWESGWTSAYYEVAEGV